MQSSIVHGVVQLLPPSTLARTKGMGPTVYLIPGQGFAELHGDSRRMYALGFRPASTGWAHAGAVAHKECAEDEDDEDGGEGEGERCV